MLAVQLAELVTTGGPAALELAVALAESSDTDNENAPPDSSALARLFDLKGILSKVV